MKRFWTATLLTLAMSAAATPTYAVATPQPVTPFVPGIAEEPLLSGAWQAWQGKEIDDYAITVQRSCFCAPKPKIRTIIRNDTTRRVKQKGKQLRAGRGYSVDELYIMIRDAQAKGHQVDVDFNRRGIPVTIAIDPEPMVADDETFYKVSVSRLR